MKKTLIIAEAGVNHNGEKKIAFKLVDAAVNAGADVIKFQIFNTEELASKETPKTQYQKKSGKNESQFDMLKSLELPYETFNQLNKYCKKKNIRFMASVFDHQSLNYLIKIINVEYLKIPSGEITNGPLLLSHAQTRRKIILSTGMASISEIKTALSIIAFGYINPKNLKPNLKNFMKIYESNEGKKILKKKVTILHCTSEYPAPVKELNLNAIKLLSKTFNLNVGYSDHSTGIETSLIAVALGAKVVEKHMTLDNNMDGPDHKASLNPTQFKEMVTLIRYTENALGKAQKRRQKSESKNIKLVRRSLYVKNDIKKNSIIRAEDISIKRPANGLSPLKYWNFVNKRSNYNMKKDDKLK